MSPAYSPRPDDVFCWVGVIMYLPPSQNDAQVSRSVAALPVLAGLGALSPLPLRAPSLQRAEIQRRFDAYRAAMEPLLDEYGATVHWAKLELPPRARAVPDTPPAAAAAAAGAGAGAAGVAGFLRSWTSSPSPSSSTPPAPPAPVSAAEKETYEQRRGAWRARLAKRYDLKGFEAFRAALDPHRTLATPMVEELLLPAPKATSHRRDGDSTTAAAAKGGQQ